MSASDKLSTKCSGLLLRSSFAILAARARHLFSVAPRLSNSSDIILRASSEPSTSVVGRLLRATGSNYRVRGERNQLPTGQAETWQGSANHGGGSIPTRPLHLPRTPFWVCQNEADRIADLAPCAELYFNSQPSLVIRISPSSFHSTPAPR